MFTPCPGFNPKENNLTDGCVTFDTVSDISSFINSHLRYVFITSGDLQLSQIEG